LIVYLRAKPETVMNRIKSRGRSCESDIPLDFLQDLHAAYEDWIERAPALCPVRTIDTEVINLRDDEDAQLELLETIREFHLEKHERMTQETTGGRADRRRTT
jgi:deoxyadenosine/deoxycytidine kinase